MSKNPFEDYFGEIRGDEILSDTSEPEDSQLPDFKGIDEEISLGGFKTESSSINPTIKETKPKIISTETLEEYLFSRHEREEPYGIFSKDITMCRYFESKDGESRLSDIEQKNREESMGNIEIPNTNIRLINYSVCPKCKKIFSYKELSEYYRRPKNDIRFSNPAEQARNDTRVYCSVCDTYFLPALIIADKTPRNEVQFLCRNQTMDAVEKYFLNMGKYVLTKNRKNIIFDSARSLKAINNDVNIQEIQQKPTLITNILQYTPANLAINFIEGTNAQNGDVLFGYWGKGI